jgi:aryl-alcohol dehydrogenase-like predicted oxidoreductase
MPMQFRRLATSHFKASTRCVGTEAKGIAPGQFAAAWVLANPMISSVIVGPRTLAHLEDVYGAVALKLDQDDEAFIDSLVVPGHVASAGYTDPAYPLFGRPA